MRSILKRRPSGSMAVAFVALLAALSGTAVALPGTNSVDSGDIKNNNVRSKDLRNNDVRGKDIRAGTVGSSDVKDNGLTGADVDESALGKVPNAANADSAANATQLGGVPASGYLQTNADTVGRSGFDVACDPTNAVFLDCATTTVPVARPSRLLVIAEAPFGVDSADTASGNCRIELNGAAVPNTTARTGFQTAAPTGNGDEANVGYGITTVTAPVSAGNHTVNIACNEDDADIDHNDSTISVVALGAG